MGLGIVTLLVAASLPIWLIVEEAVTRLHGPGAAALERRGRLAAGRRRTRASHRSVAPVRDAKGHAPA
jgi:hypothetical protein